MKRVLLFGGSFNPIHHGHLIVARAAAEKLGINRIVLIPAAVPPHKQGETMPPGELRAEMCRAAVAGDPLFEVSEWELQQPGPNYTLLTVEHFLATEADTEIFWLLGMDSLRDLHTWHRIGDLAAGCTLVTARRPGVFMPDLKELAELVSTQDLDRIRRNVLDTPQVDISATDIRHRVFECKPTRYLMPERAAEVMSANYLYEHFTCVASDGFMGLYRLKDNRFHVYLPGKLGEINCDSNCILASQRLVKLLEELIPGQFSATPRTIIELQGPGRWDTHSELVFRDRIEVDEVNKGTPPNELRAWICQDHTVIVTPALRRRLELAIPEIRCYRPLWCGTIGSSSPATE